MTKYAVERTIRQLLSIVLLLPLWLVIEGIFYVLVTLGQFLLDSIDDKVNLK